MPHQPFHFRKKYMMDGSTLPVLHEELAEVLQSHPVDSIFAHNDYLAFEAMRVIQQQRLQVPNDILLMGYANEPIAQYLNP